MKPDISYMSKTVEGFFTQVISPKSNSFSFMSAVKPTFSGFKSAQLVHRLLGKYLIDSDHQENMRKKKRSNLYG